MTEENWNTAITKVEPNKLLLRGYRIDGLMGNISFAQTIYLAIKGELPNEREAKLLDAMLVSSIDHGVTPPSCQAARNIASTGAPLNAAIAGGVLAISRHHGGAIEDAMGLLKMAVDSKKEIGGDPEAAADRIVRDYKSRGKRLPGYGHRFHSRDPRSIRLFQMAEDLDLGGEHVGMARSIEGVIEKVIGRSLPVNVDGAIGALLCDLDFPAELANGFFIMARIPGLLAHVYEEKTRMRPMRHINSKAHVYDGPPERGLDHS